MLFNSYIFIFLFLPVTLFIFFFIGRQENYRAAFLWLIGSSLFFYAWWNPAYLFLILFSIILNYSAGLFLANQKILKPIRKSLLVVAIIINLALIGYFKYTNFFIDTLNSAIGSQFPLQDIILPLAISFFTFQQIAYLVDTYIGLTKEKDFLNYCLFVSFFPQLIAGPIVHHKDLIPQFLNEGIYKFSYKTFAIGLNTFIIGLFKKVVLADGISVYAEKSFAISTEAHSTLSFLEAWGGALAFTIQIYFDFSGYSDMAIGMALMIGIVLPLNFNSPFKACSISDFWSRWHITLSNWFRSYVYIPLGGNKRGSIRTFFNLALTMLFCGLWHGASWNFIFFGLTHGVYLIINHSWKNFIFTSANDNFLFLFLKKRISHLITFLAVTVSFVFFRAESFDSALNVLASMLGFTEQFKYSFEGGIFLFWYLFVSLIIVWCFPNSQQISRFFTSHILGIVSHHPKLLWFNRVRPLAYSVVFASMLFLAIVFMQSESEFIYFRF